MEDHGQFPWVRFSLTKLRTNGTPPVFQTVLLKLLLERLGGALVAAVVRRTSTIMTLAHKRSTSGTKYTRVLACLLLSLERVIECSDKPLLMYVPYSTANDVHEGNRIR